MARKIITTTDFGWDHDTIYFFIMHSRDKVISHLLPSHKKISIRVYPHVSRVTSDDFTHSF